MIEEEPNVERSVGGRVKKAFLDRFIGSAHRKVSSERDTVRQLQIETGRTAERVIALLVYELSVKHRDVVKQSRFDYNVSIQDGEAVFLDGSPDADLVVRTDLPTILSLMRNELKVENPGSEPKVIKPFRPTDALRLGLLETEGRATALKDLMLLERTVIPRLGAKLGLRA